MLSADAELQVAVGIDDGWEWEGDIEPGTNYINHPLLLSLARFLSSSLSSKSKTSQTVQTFRTLQLPLFNFPFPIFRRPPPPPPIK